MTTVIKPDNVTIAAVVNCIKLQKIGSRIVLTTDVCHYAYTKYMNEEKHENSQQEIFMMPCS
jgi:hypothetical protein